MSQTQTGPTPLDRFEQITQRISELQTKMQSKTPGYEALLQVIHRNLSQDNEVVTMLTEEQIGAIFAGLSQMKGIIIAEAAGKNKTSGGKSLKNIGLEDL
jgi:hypothetical protein